MSLREWIVGPVRLGAVVRHDGQAAAVITGLSGFVEGASRARAHADFHRFEYLESPFQP